MEITVISILLGILFIGLLSYQILAQKRERELILKRQEIFKQKKIITMTEELLDAARVIPFNKNIFICLHGRIFDCINMILLVDPKNREFKAEREQKEKYLEALSNLDENKESCSFQIPKNDKQAIILLKIIKRLKYVIRSEHNRGRLSTDFYSFEMSRLDLLQLKINIENAFQRAKDALATGQLGTTQQLLNKSITLLENRNDVYSLKKLEKMKELLAKTNGQVYKNNQKQLKDKIEKEKDERDELFGDKKKW